MKVYIDTKKRQLFVVATVLLCHIFINTITVSALTYQNSVNVEFTINPTISISLSSPDLIIDNLTPGSSSDSNIITVDVSTNAGYGYYMSATAGTSTGNTNLTSTTSSSVFTNLSTNTASLNAFPDNYWGYSYSTDNGTTWISGSHGDTSTGYNGLPLDNDDSGATGVILAETDSFTNTGSIKFKIGAKAAATQATGTYTNTVNFYAVANPEPTLGPVSCQAGRICYNVNSLGPTEGIMGSQGTSDGNTVQLYASNFSRQGYGFAGWSDAYDYATNPNAHFYGPNEDITVPSGTSTNGLPLYAVWIRSAGTMQDNTAAVCNSLTAATYNDEGDSDESTWSITANLNSVSALTDTRDGDTYAIAKLTDGKCWMIENLRLADTHKEGGNTVNTTLTTTNTNNPLNDGTTVTLKHEYSDTATYTNLSPTSSSATSWCKTSSADCIDQSRIRTNNTTNRHSSTQMTSPNISLYSYGNYYNWYSATAGRGTYDLGSSVSATGDICPFGWHLPTSFGPGEFDRLSNSLGGYRNVWSEAQQMNDSTTPTGTIMAQRIRRFPTNLLYSGYVNGSALGDRGSRGSLWSSTAMSGSGAYDVYFSPSDVAMGVTGRIKYTGSAVRCIANSI